MTDQNDQRVWRRRPYSIFGPLLLIAIGVVLFLKTFGVIDGNLWHLFLRTWPILFVVSGLDSLYRGESYVGGVVWTGLGIMLLLGTLGYWQLAPWGAILRLWPFLLIIWGLDILFHRKKLWSAAIGVLLGLGMLAVIYWAAVSTPMPAPIQVETFQQSLEGAKSASIDVESTTGQLWIGTGAEPSNLVEGELQLMQDEVEKMYSVSDGAGEFVLKSISKVAAPFWISGSDSRRQWKIKLNAAIPLDIKTKMIVGEQTLNLSGLEPEEVYLETILGQSVIILPAAGDFQGESSLIIGEMIIYMLPNTPIQLDLDTGLTSVQYPDDFVRDGDTLFSPAAQKDIEVIHLLVNLPLGSLKVKYIEK